MILLESIDDDIFFNKEFKDNEGVGYFKKQNDDLKGIKNLYSKFKLSSSTMSNWLVNFDLYTINDMNVDNELEYTSNIGLDDFIDVLDYNGIDYSIDTKNKTISFNDTVFNTMKKLENIICADYYKSKEEIKKDMANTIMNGVRNKRNLATLMGIKNKYQKIIDDEIGKNVLGLAILDGMILKVELYQETDIYDDIIEKYSYRHIDINNANELLDSLIKDLIG
ncbi:MAG: hypothetical protein MJZ34_05010 [Paludibacteraceae bacterium]|nr:hypothetical protein [Paludibacteraceae bacterium]